MERNLAIVLLFILCSTLYVANGVAPPEPSTPVTPAVHKWPYHPAPPNVQKCLSSFQSLHECFSEISSQPFWWLRHPSVTPACCNATQEISDDCADTVYGHFHNPFFALFLKAHCSQSQVSAAPPPQA